MKVSDVLKTREVQKVESGIKDKERVKNHGEVFTPANIVNDMTDMADKSLIADVLGHELDTEKTGEDYVSYAVSLMDADMLKNYLNKTFLEPSAGNGNFLVEILQRKLIIVKKLMQLDKANTSKYVLWAFSKIYGIDILSDNVEEAQTRMINVLLKNNDIVESLDETERDAKNFKKCLAFILNKNIICGDTLNKKYISNQEPIEIYDWQFNSSDNLKVKQSYFNDDTILEEEAYDGSYTKLYDATVEFDAYNF